MKRLFSRECPICASMRAKCFYRNKLVLPANFSLNNTQDILCCDECGMIFSDSGNTEEDFNNYYSRSAKYSLSSLSPAAITANQERFKQTYKRIVDVINTDSLVCDLGCGGGDFLNYLSRKGFKKLSGIDNGALGDSQKKFNYIQSSVYHLKYHSLPKFNIIVCTGVLEHLYNPKLAIMSMTDLMDSKGYLYIEVPDAEAYSRNVISPFQDFNLEHINHFSKLALKNLFHKYDIEVIEMGTIEQRQSARYTMPVISALLKKSPSLSKELRKDEALSLAIESYNLKSSELLKEIDLDLSSKLSGIGSVYIWGVGQLTLKLLNLEVFKKVSILGFVDRNSTIPGIGEASVITDISEIQKDIPILIGSILHIDSIKADIKKFQLTNPIIDLITR